MPPSEGEIVKIMEGKGYPSDEIAFIFDANHNDLETLLFIAKIMSPYAKGQYEFSKC